MTESTRTVGVIVPAILILALMYVAQSVFAPLVFSLFIIAVVWPCQSILQRYMPRGLALLITLVVSMAVMIAVGSSLVWGISKLGQWFFVNADRLQSIYLGWTDWLEEHGIALVGPLADRFDVLWVVRFMQGMAGRLNSFAGFLLLVFIFLMLGLLEVDDFNKRLTSPYAQPYGKTILLCDRIIGAKLRRYMLVRTFASVLTGLIVWLFALGAGLELATAWGAIAFSFNYIPVLGPLFATTLPTLFAIVQFDSWQFAIVVFLSLNVIQFVIGSYLEPRLAGASLSISPFAVIFAVFFWSFMWGIAGAFIGVPILIAVIVFCAASPSLAWIATLMSNDKPLLRDAPPGDLTENPKASSGTKPG
ncbi:AI-2E family transporter [Ochrobactrum sp. Kaboul]|nr:AI-2E family transporter [Ochrobactrum sp. Kaboul]